MIRFHIAGLAWSLSTAFALAAAPDFDTQVLPVLTRAGCNSGSCHGAAIGRGGFHLSLLGYDPKADYDALVHEFEGRRVHLVQPEKSLVLRKPSGQVPHEGLIRLGKQSEGFQVVLDWIKAGAPRGGGRTLQALNITPTSQTLKDLDQQFSIKVSARFSDGATEDVTRWAVFTPTDTAAVKCNAQGDVSVLRRGQSAVMVRFLGEVGCVQVVVPQSDTPLVLERPRGNFVDDHVNRALDQLRLPHSPRADAAMLARRLFLDLCGTLPTPAEVEAFVADPKVEKLVDQLMARPEFVDHWTYKWGDLFRIESRRLQQGTAAFHGWVRDQVSQNTPWDRVARAMLLALGDGLKVGPANFHRVGGDAPGEAEYFSQVFLGVRLQCANCHNHPLDRWSQDDYHGLSAVFVKLNRGQVVQLQAKGEVIHPKTGKPATPRLPGTSFLQAEVDNRQRLADWLTGPENPYFARNLVNRLWRELMGRGLVEPVDDHRSTNPATNPELLAALAKDFVDHKFDVRHAIRTIVLSEAYRRGSLSVAGNQADDRFAAKALVRPLPPTVLVDAVAKVAGVPEANLPGRAIALGDSRVASEPLNLLGRCNRDNGCTTASAAGLPLTLHVINGDWLNKKIADPQGRLSQLVQAKRSDAEIVTTLYEVALARKPSAKELDHWKSRLAGDQREKKLEDFLWALLNSVEFTSNH